MTTEPSTRVPGTSPPWLTWAGFTLVAFGVAGAIQFLFAKVPSDADTAYHAAVGRLIAEHGILRSFPWTPMSWLADHYADKELLFHLLYLPFNGLGWITASKLVGTVGGAAVLLSLFGVLRAERVRYPAAWALLPLLVSSAFLYRFALVRPHLLSIALVPIVLWAASRERVRVLAVASFLYPGPTWPGECPSSWPASPRRPGSSPGSAFAGSPWPSPPSPSPSGWPSTRTARTWSASGGS